MSIAGRRIHCFSAKDFAQPPAAIGEYCWNHGAFAKNVTGSDIVISHQSWLLQTYLFFYIQSFLFALPHLVWNLKHKAWLIALLKGTEELANELESLWLKYSELADKAYREVEHRLDNDPVGLEEELKRAENAVKAMTRDTVQITQQQIPHYTALFRFIQFRLVYDTVVLAAIVIFNLSLFKMCNKYDSSDYYCPLPNGEMVRCMIPMMLFEWNSSLLCLLATGLTFLVTTTHSFYLVLNFMSPTTQDCFLEKIPYAKQVADLTWDNNVDRKTYKLLSMLMLQNSSILRPLNFLDSFVHHLQQVHQIEPEVTGSEVKTETKVNHKGLRKRGQGQGHCNHDGEEVELLNTSNV